MKGVGRRTQLLDDLRNRIIFWEVKEEAEYQKRWKRPFINKEQTQVIFHKFMDMLISSILNNNS